MPAANFVQQTKQEITRYFQKTNFEIAFTGTFKQVFQHPTGSVTAISEYLDIEKAAKNVDHFLNAASRRVFGCCGAKKGDQLHAVGLIEGDSRASVTGGKRIHAHLMIGGFPEAWCQSISGNVSLKTQLELENVWQNTKWGWHDTDVQLMINNSESTISRTEGWLEYILKDLNKFETERLIIRHPFSSLHN